MKLRSSKGSSSNCLCFVFLYPRLQIATQFFKTQSCQISSKLVFAYPLFYARFTRCISGIKKPQLTLWLLFLWLPDLDSNQDKLHQKQSYYHYTIRQSYAILRMDCKNRVRRKIFQIIILIKAIIIKLA